MDDATLLAELVEMFDSREEAEHYVACDRCSLTGEDGPYRCGDNPVSKREAVEAEAQHFGEVMVYLARGCPPYDPTKVAIREMGMRMVQRILQPLSWDVDLGGVDGGRGVATFKVG